MEKVLIIIAIELAVIFDAIRDALLTPAQNYWYYANILEAKIQIDRWHIAKWISFYSPLVVLLWIGDFIWYEIAIIAIFNFFLWRRIYERSKD